MARPLRLVIAFVSFGLLALLVALSFMRVAMFAEYVRQQIDRPYEAYHLESKMVHLSWRVLTGAPLYPDWRTGPYNCNFFGPLYFLVIGGIGRLTSASLDGLVPIGRSITVASVVVAAIATGWAAWSRWGRLAGFFAATLAVGSAPMFGFGVMVRPDVPADTLGFIGFLVAAGATAGRKRLVLGGLLLVAAVLTKQTTIAYLIAAVLAQLAVGRPRVAIQLGVGAFGSLVLVVLLGTFFWQPLFAESLLGESKSPIDLPLYLVVIGRLGLLAREIPILSLLGLLLWSRGPYRDRPLAVLAAVLLVFSFTTALKLGSDLNYFLGLRLVAALAGATIVHASVRTLTTWTRGPTTARNPAESAWVGLALLLALAALDVAVLPGAQHAWMNAAIAIKVDNSDHTASGRELLRVHETLRAAAADPSQPLLTDSGDLALRQLDHAPFTDPWLFRMMVETGRIQPQKLLDQIEHEEFEYLVTLHDLQSPTYDTYTFGLPPVLARPARAHYAFSRQAGPFFIYRPMRALFPGAAKPAAP